MRRSAAVLLTTALTAAGAVALPAPAAAAEIVPRDLTITVTGLGPENRTCDVDADLYVPAGVTSVRPGPALLVTNGFGGTKADQADLAQGFGEHGYVTLSYTGLGFADGDPRCPITLDDVDHDGAAAAQLLRFLGGDPAIRAVDDDDPAGRPVRITEVVREDARTGTRYDPAVGMIGGSYGGQVQFATAAFERRRGTDRLDAIVPFITWNDLSYSLAPENSTLPGGTARSGSVSAGGTGVFKYQWSALFTALGVARGLEDAPALTDPSVAAAYGQRNCVDFEPEVCRALAEVGTLGHPSEDTIGYLRSNSVASYISQVRVPTLIGQGQADTLFNLQESVATYRSLKRQGTPVALVWQSWGHSDPAPAQGELDLREPASSHQGRQALAWFEHHVRGRGPAPRQDFSYFRDWVHEATGDASRAYATAPSFPVGDPTTFYLSGTSTAGRDGALVPSRSRVVPGTSAWASTLPVGPNHSETSGPFPQQEPVDPPGSAVRFATPPLARPVDVVGSPRLTVQLDAPGAARTQGAGPAGQLVLVAKLYDVGPDGTAVELPERLVSPVRVPDVTGPVTVELPGIVHRFDRGHRLAVVLAGGDAAYRGSTQPQAVTLTTGPEAPNALTLPVVR